MHAYGLDAVRFFVLREAPFGADGDFSEAALIRRLNGELANDLGNLAQRTLSQIARNLDGRLPPRGPATQEDRALLDAAEALPAALRPLMDRMALGEALEQVWRVIRSANAYVDHQAPWALRKTDPERMASVLRALADALRVIATVLTPFMPGQHGAAARSAWRSRGGPPSRGAGAAARRRNRAAAAAGRVSTSCRRRRLNQAC